MRSGFALKGAFGGGRRAMRCVSRGKRRDEIYGLRVTVGAPRRGPPGGGRFDRLASGPRFPPGHAPHRPPTSAFGGSALSDHACVVCPVAVLGFALRRLCLVCISSSSSRGLPTVCSLRLLGCLLPASPGSLASPPLLARSGLPRLAHVASLACSLRLTRSHSASLGGTYRLAGVPTSFTSTCHSVPLGLFNSVRAPFGRRVAHHAHRRERCFMFAVAT